MSLLLSVLATLSLAQAGDPPECTYLVERGGGTQLQRMWNEDSQVCSISVHPMEAYYDLIYRDYSFSSDGLFMVFNSFGPGEDSSSTGAREFFLFPRPVGQLSHSWDDSTQRLTIKNITGDEFVFDSRKARLMSITRGNVIVANDVDPKNKGGVEFQDFPGLIMDGGWSLGASPTGKKSNSSVFQDAKGKKCSVKNSELFKYTSTGDNIFKFRSDSGLQSFLKTRCPSITFQP